MGQPGETLTADDVREMLRRACESAGGRSKWATNHSLSAAFVSDVLNGKRYPSAGISQHLGVVENPRSWRLDEVRKHA